MQDSNFDVQHIVINSKWWQRGVPHGQRKETSFTLGSSNRSASYQAKWQEAPVVPVTQATEARSSLFCPEITKSQNKNLPKS